MRTAVEETSHKTVWPDRTGELNKERSERDSIVTEEVTRRGGLFC